MARKQAILFFILGVIVCIGWKNELEEKWKESRLHTKLSFEPKIAGFQASSLSRYHFGFKNFLSGLMWVELLQRAKFQPIQEGEVSWEYVQLSAINALDPDFIPAYSFGGVFLSVLRQDKEGAHRLIERWQKKMGSDWRPHYLLGYHLFYELSEYEQAAKHIIYAAKFPEAPSWLSSLGVRLLTESGGLLPAMAISLQLHEQLRHRDDARRRLTVRIRSLNYYLQKHAWEKALDRYKQKRGNVPSLLKALIPFYTSKVRRLAMQPNLSTELSRLLGEKFSFKISGGQILSTKSPLEYGLDPNLGIHKNPRARGRT